MVSDEALKKLQEQIAAWPMTQRFVVQQLIEDYRRDREDLRAYKNTGLTPEEIKDAYEKNTGLVIIEEFKRRGIDPAQVPAVLVHNHGPFTWGKTPEKAVENALVLDECAHMALLTRLFDPSAAPAAQCIQDKHYFRKHGANAYYGQKKK